MSRRDATIGADWFEALYRADPDPWGFRTSAYERDKYRATLAALSRPRYARGLEIGCAIGVLTRQLAPRCERLLALDGSETALAAARRDGADQPQVVYLRGTVPADFPAGRFDLIVLSEVLYYLDPTDLAAVAARCCAGLAPDGEVVLCHWLGETDYPLTGRDASDLFAQAVLRRLPRRERLAEAAYRLERFRAA